MAFGRHSGFPKVGGQDSGTGTSVSVGSVTTTGAALLVCSFAWANDGSQTLSPCTVSGAGLSWTKRVEYVATGSYPGHVVCAVWTAPASGALSNQTVSVQRTGTTTYNTVAVSVDAFTDAEPGASGGYYNTAATVLAATIAGTTAGSYIVGAWGRGDATTEPTLRADTTRDRTGSNASATSRVNTGRLTNTSAGGSVTVGCTISALYAGAAALEIKATAGGGGESRSGTGQSLGAASSTGSVVGSRAVSNTAVAISASAILGLAVGTGSPAESGTGVALTATAALALAVGTRASSGTAALTATSVLGLAVGVAELPGTGSGLPLTAAGTLAALQGYAARNGTTLAFAAVAVLGLASGANPDGPRSRTRLALPRVWPRIRLGASGWRRL